MWALIERPHSTRTYFDKNIPTNAPQLILCLARVVASLLNNQSLCFIRYHS